MRSQGSLRDVARAAADRLGLIRARQHLHAHESVDACPDEVLLGAFRGGERVLKVEDVRELEALLGTRYVQDWLIDARRRGLLVEHGTDGQRRLYLTEVGRQRYDAIFRSSLSVSL